MGCGARRAALVAEEDAVHVEAQLGADLLRVRVRARARARARVRAWRPPLGG